MINNNNSCSLGLTLLLLYPWTAADCCDGVCAGNGVGEGVISGACDGAVPDPATAATGTGL